LLGANNGHSAAFPTSKAAEISRNTFFKTFILYFVVYIMFLNKKSISLQKQIITDRWTGYRGMR